MTEKRFSVKNNWITDNYIGKLLNIDFNTITDANLCCGLLNQIEDEKKQNGKIASKFLEENEQLKNELEKLSYANEDLLEEKRIWKQMSDEYTKLSYENEQLNLLSNLRGEMVSFATSLIQDMGSEEMLKMWNDFKEVMYQKWKKGD